jgi:hypothetical protein
MRKALLVVGIAVIHLVLSAGLMLSAMGAAMGRMDHGGDPNLGERIVSGTAIALLFPLVHPLGQYLFRLIPSGPPWEHMIFAANSLLWAIVLVTLVSRWSMRQISNEALQPTGAK